MFEHVLRPLLNPLAFAALTLGLQWNIYEKTLETILFMGLLNAILNFRLSSQYLVTTLIFTVIAFSMIILMGAPLTRY